MKKSIKEYTEYLFHCTFTDDAFDAEGHEDHLKASWELFDQYQWEEVYPVWRQYLHDECDSPEKVINFANLYFYYDVADKPIPDPVDFISYLYYKVDMDKYWDAAGDLFDSLTIEVMTTAKLVDIVADPYYSPFEDKRIQEGVARWKKRDAST